MRLVCLLLMAAPVWADRCQVPAEQADIIQGLPSDASARRAALDEALKTRPGDFTLNRLIVEHGVYQRRAVRERYQHEFDAHPDSLDAAYLYARSLVGSSTTAALKIYARILARDPDYPWVHLSQLEIYRAEAFRDRQKLAGSFAAIRRVCPAEWKPLEYLGEIEDTEVVAREAAGLRAFLAASQDPHRFRLYRFLWAAEFRIRPKPEQEAERRIVAADLRRLRPFESLPEIQTVMANGARLAGDDALAKEIAEATAKRPPDLFGEYSEWHKTHVYPKPDDPPEIQRAYAQARLRAAAEWIAQAPRDPLGYNERLQALVTLEAPAGDLGRAGDDLLAADWRRDYVPHSFFTTVARAYVERGVLLDRVPAIVEEALKSFDDPESVIEIDLAPSPERTAESRMRNVAYHVEAMALLSELYEKQGQADKAGQVLRSLEDYLTAKAPSHDAAGNAGESVMQQYRQARFTYWRRVAALAEHEGRKLDALSAYRAASTAWGIPSEPVLAAQRRLWKELGGSDEAWSQWIGAASETDRQPARRERVAFVPVNRPLPEFSLQDVSGNPWTLARFKRKTTVAVVWSTWCAPCRKELPYFAKLVEKLKGRADVQAVSFNTDANSGLVEPFLKQNGYVFPALLARHLAEDLMPYFSIPRTWIIRDGVLTAEARGFGGEPEHWTEDIMAQLEERPPQPDGTVPHSRP